MCVPEQIGTCTPLPPPPPQDSITTDSATLARLKEAISAAEATPPAALARLPELWPAGAGGAPALPTMSDDCDPARVVHGTHAPQAGGGGGGGGGGGAMYRWAQSMSEVVVCVPVPPGVKSRDLACTFKRRQLVATLKGAASPLLRVDELLSAVRPDGCLWTLLGETLQLSLEKEAHGRFWRCLCEGHAEVTLPSWWPLAV